jgi:hypothetical protein
VSNTEAQTLDAWLEVVVPFQPGDRVRVLYGHSAFFVSGELIRQNVSGELIRQNEFGYWVVLIRSGLLIEASVDHMELVRE